LVHQKQNLPAQANKGIYMEKQILNLPQFTISPDQPLAIICGPCVIEGEDFSFSCAKTLKDMFEKAGCNLIFKSSYDKANRSSIHSYRGPGLEKGLQILEKIKKELNIPILTDVHSAEEAVEAAKVCDIIQIPAFLCRQTDLLVSAGKTNCIINVKKGQFMAPWDMKNVIEKVLSTGNKNLFITERGNSFGYNNLVSDMRAIPIMQQWGFPVCFDASHSVQMPGALGAETGGDASFIPVLAKASLAAGADLLFIESHPDPKNGKSDKSSMLSFENLKILLEELSELHKLLQKHRQKNRPC
jgi:2-dehydro-3-deoxyphosphooctonate aldolase (KDO 8-P synthase)